MVIDAHVHVYPPEIRDDQERISRIEPYFGKLTNNKYHKWGTWQELLKNMDEDGIEESWICGFAFSDISLCRICNDYVLDAFRSSGGRLKPLAVVPPLAPSMDREIERCAAGGAVGVGELFPEGQGFNIDDPRETWQLAMACHETGLFVSMHTAEPVGHDYPGKGSVTPKEALEFCSNHPELKVVLAHWGGGLFMYEVMPELRRILKNVWYDTAATPFLYDHSIFEAAAASGVVNKILYGSDAPLIRFGRYNDLLNKTNLCKSAKYAILGGNALAFRMRRDH